MSDQAFLPSLDWPALIPGPVFLQFELDGEPGHKGRPRARIVSPRDGRPSFIHFYAEPATAAYEKTLSEYVGLLMRHREPTLQPVALLIHAYLKVPKSWGPTDRAKAFAGNIRPGSKPDFDNFAKSCCDAMNGIVWRDDAQVVDGRCIKLYSARPALRVEVREFITP